LKKEAKTFVNCFPPCPTVRRRAGVKLGGNGRYG
jgi:hypothetical protein